MRGRAVVWAVALSWILSSTPAGAAPVPVDAPAPAAPPTAIAAATEESAPPHHCDKQPAGTKFRITLPKDADLDDLVHWMTSISCRRFVWESGLRRGKVTILAADAVTLTEAFAVFHAALETMGLAIEPHDGFEKIVESGSAAGRVVPVYEPGHEPPEDDRWVTQIIRTAEGHTADIVALVTALKGEGLQGEIRVTADPETRSLVILASPSDFIAVERVIKELDRERRQVYIEVFLLELSTDKTLQLGASAHFGAPTGGDGLGFVSSQQGDASSFALSPSVLSGLAAGVIGPSIPGTAALTGTDIDIPSFGVVIQALQTDGDVNFVADTHIYTADNKTGKIEVGGTRPTIGATQQIPVGGGLVNQQTIERIKAALSLEVTPHVHDSRTVSLDIKLDNESFGAADALGIPTNSRKLELEHVLARDDQPLVLGGLVQERETISQTEVPGLGKIPLLGWMFKSKKRRTEKVNMLMILVPHILETPQDARRIHTRRLQERLEFLERHTAFKRRDLDTHVN